MVELPRWTHSSTLTHGILGKISRFLGFYAGFFPRSIPDAVTTRPPCANYGKGGVFLAATCTQEGYTGDIVCTVCGEVVETGQVIARLAHDYQGGKCTVCGSLDPAFQPEIIAGANGTWQQGSRDPLSFTSNAAYDDFRKVQVDGKDLAPSNYTVKEGSTIVSLNAAYLETLSVGKHTLSVVSQTGTATTEFTIQAPPATGGDPQSPQTNDSSHMALWLGVLASCGVLLSTGLWYNRRRNGAKHQ